MSRHISDEYVARGARVADHLVDKDLGLRALREIALGQRPGELVQRVARSAVLTDKQARRRNARKALQQSDTIGEAADRLDVDRRTNSETFDPVLRLDHTGMDASHNHRGDRDSADHEGNGSHLRNGSVAMKARRFVSSRIRVPALVAVIWVGACASPKPDPGVTEVSDVGDEVDVADVDSSSPVDLSTDASTDVGSTVKDVGADGDVGRPPMWLPNSMVCGIAPETIEYPDSDWSFTQPDWGMEIGGPWTVDEFREGFVGTQTAMLRSPAKRHRTDPNVSTLWLIPGDDLVIHLAVQSDPDNWQDGRIAVTPMLDYEPIPEAEYVWWDADREERKGEFDGTGALIPMESQTELFDLRIPAEVFEEERYYELALAVRARSGVTHRVISSFERFGVYAGGADRLAHPCIPPGEVRDLEEVFPFDEYGDYLAGRHKGLVYPRGIDWGELWDPRVASVGDQITFDWFLRAHSRQRNVAFVPVVNGKPVGPVTFQQIEQEAGRSMDLAHSDTFVATMPDGDFVDVYVAEWFDVRYPPRSPQGPPNYFPPDDAHGHDGVRVHAGTGHLGTNALRYHLESE